ncbi:MAG: hypothetical protein PHU25_06300 [Deltaproteobacteria bacterium]|nr:hypothetical protein [Deltaproteobacteria bacterium]
MPKTERDMGVDRGAVMVMATFAALFLVALVYHVAGVGGAALEQQIMQDAADATAYSAATAKARGMNILALINLVMAAVLSVLVAIKVLQAVLVTAIAAVGVACVVTSGAACGAMAPLGMALQRVTDIADDLEPAVKRILQGLEKAADVVNEVVPVLAQAEAVYISTRGEYDPAELGFAWPVAGELPTRKGSFEELCEKAGEDVVVASTFFLPGGLPEMAQSTVGELVGGVASSFSSYFCGGSGSPPKSTRKTDKAHPLTEHVDCDASGARPSGSSASCETSACARCSAWGCAYCLPRQDDGKYGKGLWTVRKDVWVQWPVNGGGAQSAAEVTDERKLEWIEEDPCDEEGSCGHDPICETTGEEDASGEGFPDGAIRVTRLSYLALHGCVTEETTTIEAKGQPMEEVARPREPDPDKLPEGARVRAFVLGGTAAGKRLDGTGIAAEGGSDVASAPGRFSFAAAEFFCSRAASPAETGDLWQMDWLARLIRFRQAAGGGGFAGSCEGPFAAQCASVGTGADGAAKGVPAGLEDWVLH